MPKDYIEKGLIFLLLTIWVVSSAGPILKKVPSIAERVSIRSFTLSQKEKDEISKRKKILENAKVLLKKPAYRTLFTADIFKRPVYIPPPSQKETLKVRAIYHKLLPLIYDGYMINPDGTLTAQLNYRGNTLFRTEGEEAKSFRILKITKEAVTVEKNGQILKLEINKPLPSSKLVANIYDEGTEQLFIGLRKNDSFNGKKILDIKHNSVVILEGGKEKVLLLKK